ncbi:MAG: hypothetical protein COA43_00600 [Robiginitomaculum sp.]|nr:MAG: hypothetical protein COA43_00600 [Robiginitomaculum sp.]
MMGAFIDLDELDRKTRNNFSHKIKQNPVLKPFHIIWNEHNGFSPNDAGYGTEQFTLRPYIPGYGCDGTTDSNIHIVAHYICEVIGINYAEYYGEYHEMSLSDAQEDISRMWNNSKYVTDLPFKITSEEVKLMLRDLYDINNRSLEIKVGQACKEKGYDIDWW